MSHLVATALGPIVFVIALGWFGGRSGKMPDGSTAVLARFVIEFALPLALFLAALKSNPDEIFQPSFILALAVGLLGVFAVGYFCSRRLFRRTVAEAGMQALACSFPNMAYCGPPVISAVVGAGGLIAVVLGNLIVTLVSVPIALMLVARAGETHEAMNRSYASAILHTLARPLVFLPAAGAVLAVAGVHPPALLIASLDQVGRAAGGTALFTLGLILAQAHPTFNREVAFNVAMKNVVQPAVILGTALAIGMTGPALKTALLIGVLPTAIEVATLSTARGVYAKQAADTTVASTLFAVVSISVGIAIASVL